MKKRMEIRDTEIWRQIPPEEKVELMSQAHSKGVFAAFMAIVIACTLAVGFKVSLLMWASFLMSPFIFQLSAGRAWKSLRPRLMLEYLAARSAARRYAFTAKSKDLGLSLIFKGKIERIYKEDSVNQALEAAFQNNKETTAWIALFNDAVVVMSEKIGGAKLEFAHLVDSKLQVDVEKSEADGHLSDNCKVLLTSAARGKVDGATVKLTSKYPAAMLVFAQRLEEFKRGALPAIAQPVIAATEDDADPDWMKDFPELN